MLFGPFWYVFWIGNLLLGTAVPLLLLAAFPRRPKVVGLAGLMIAALFLSVRLNIVIPGLTRPELEGLQHAFTDQRLTFSYFPSTTELLVGLFVVAFGVGLFFLGQWLLPITGLWILGLDWLLFTQNTIVLGLATPLLVILGFIGGTLGTYVFQSRFAGDRGPSAWLKSLLAGIVVGVPFPLAGTFVGGWILFNSGLASLRDRFLRRN